MECPHKTVSFCILLYLEHEHLSPEESDGVKVSLTYVGAKGRAVWPGSGGPGCRGVRLFTRPSTCRKTHVMSVFNLVLHSFFLSCHVIPCSPNAIWSCGSFVSCIMFSLGLFDLKRHCTDWSVYDIKVWWEWLESRYSICFWIALMVLWRHTPIGLRSAASCQTHLLITLRCIFLVISLCVFIALTFPFSLD